MTEETLPEYALLICYYWGQRRIAGKVWFEPAGTPVGQAFQRVRDGARDARLAQPGNRTEGTLAVSDG